MKLSTKIKSKLSVSFSKYFPNAYKRFTLKHVNEQNNLPEAVLSKRLKECKVALFTSAGAHLKSDTPFDVDNPQGDHTFRIIPSYVKEDELTVTHIYYDTKSAKIDPSIVFPINQLNELADRGVIGSVSDVNIGINGGILDTTLVESETIPKVVDKMKLEKVDVALLVPGWGACHNVLGLYARALEKEGIVTAMVTILPDITEKLGVPRTLHVPFKLGRPCGEPFDFKTREKVVNQLLQLIEKPTGTMVEYVD